MQKPDDTRDLISGIFRLISAGQLEQAEKDCHSALSKHPLDVNVIALHGAILLKLMRLNEAQHALQKVITLEPAFAKPHEDLGRLFLLRKQPAQAVRYFTKAIDLDASQASAFSGLALALAQVDRHDEAKVAHEKFLELSPVSRTLIEAEKRLTEGDVTTALKLCNDCLGQQPDNTLILRLMARIASDSERYSEAETLLRRIVNLSPNEHLPANELGRFLAEQGRYPEAVEMFEQAISVNKDIPDSFHLLGDALAVIGRSVDALESYQRALLLDPGNQHGLAGQGHMQRILGNRSAAVDSYEKCTELYPEFGDAWWSLASLKGYQLSNEQVQTIHTRLASGQLIVNAEIAMRFALARSFEFNKEYEEAWAEYSCGNALKREQINYDPVQTEVMHDAIIEQFSKEFLDQAAPIAKLQQTPIFILGMPRSGSTLIEQVLASHSMVEGAGELPYAIMLSSSLGGQRQDGLRYPEVISELSGRQFESLANAYLYHSRVHRKQNAAFFTDKMPANFSHVGLIHLMLPGAKIIDARRHPMATCVANFRQLYAQGKNQTYDLVECAEYYLEYIRMIDHWDMVLPGRVLRVQYEDIVADFEGQIRNLLDFCGLPWEDNCLEFHNNNRPVNTMSADQVREPIYTDAVEFWKHYEPQLASIREILTLVLPTNEPEHFTSRRWLSSHDVET